MSMYEEGCDAEDKYIGQRDLDCEGRWFEAYMFECPDGSRYEIWWDQDGDSKVVDK